MLIIYQELDLTKIDPMKLNSQQQEHRRMDSITHDLAVEFKDTISQLVLIFQEGAFNQYYRQPSLNVK